MAIIVREQGGSVQTFKSTGTARFSSGASLIADTGACVAFKPTATATCTAYEILSMGNNKWWYMPGSAGSPVVSGSPGDMLWLANSASTSLWLNVSDGAAGSKWTAVGVAGSQVPTQ